MFARALPRLRLACAGRTIALNVAPAAGRVRQTSLASHNISKATRRAFSTPASTTPTAYSISTLSMDEYHRISDVAMDRLLESLEAVVDSQDSDQHEVDYHSGVLTLKLGDQGTYVLNKQPPNKQIWLSSPLSGPKRYDYDAAHNVWFYTRDQQPLDELLSQELSQLLNTNAKINLQAEN